MANRSTSPARGPAASNTVKLSSALQLRVARAMKVEGFTVWSEFCRVALTEKCHDTEDRLRSRDAQEYDRIYCAPVTSAPKLAD